MTLQNPSSRAVDPSRESAESLYRMQKLEVIERLSGGVAHDFNNSFQNIVASMELVRKLVAAGRGNEVERFIASAMSSAHLAAALTQRWFDFTRSSPPPRALAINDVVAEVAALLLRTLSNSIRVEVDLSPEPWLAFGDADQIETALLTLAVRARDAMPEEGELVIRTRNVDIAADTTDLAGVRPGQYVCISVTDFGAAMDDESLRRAFDVPTHAQSEGTGAVWGLALVRNIARQNAGGATIRADGGGTTVSIFLPRHVAEHEKAGA